MSSDYIGRTIDLLAYQGAPGRGEVLTIQALAQPGKTGQITTGIQKLAQRFLLELLTEVGSIPHLPTRGCQFMVDANSGTFQNQYDVLASFSQSLVDITENMQSVEKDTDPDDERFDRAEVESVAFTPGNASISVRIYSLAGTSRTVIAPLNTTI